MDIYSLLKINQGSINNFSFLANRVADHQIEKFINEQIRKLREIENRMPEDKGLKISNQSIEEVIRKVMLHSTHKGHEGEWSIRELRIISYYLMKLRGYDDAYSYAISLLDKHWKSLYINGLVFLLMNSWNTLEANYKEQAVQLLVKKLQLYTGTNKRYICLKDHCNLLEPTGPIRLAALLQHKGIDLKDAPTILGYRPSTLGQSYYSDVIIRYVKANNIHNLDVIDDIFEVHNMDRTKKLVLAHLVERENYNPDGLKRAQLCKYVNRILGDVSMATTWAPFIGATEEEARILKRSMELVNNWFKQQIIETFFEICVQDATRRNFWLQYVNEITSFKIVGSKSVRIMLQGDNRIGSLFIRHFIETNSNTSQTAALILFIKDKMLVEFSDMGALYVYKHNHSQVKMVLQSKGRIDSINDLKIPSMGPIIEANYWGDYDFQEEGRMNHIGYWVSRLTRWMDKILLSKEISFSPFTFDKKAEELFKAKPAPIETIKEPEPTFSGKEVTPQESQIQVNSQTHQEENNDNTTHNNFQEEEVLEYIPIDIVSNIIAQQIRVISNNEGFYLYKEGKKKFILLKHFTSSSESGGKLQLLEARMKDWYEIIHSKDGVMKTIGYIKEAKYGNGFLFKERMDIAAKRRLKF